jgi:hypothetical protein
MCDQKRKEERQRGGTAEGVPQLAPLALAGHAGRPPQLPPPAEVASEAATLPPDADEAFAAEPFAEPIGPTHAAACTADNPRRP